MKLLHRAAAFRRLMPRVRPRRGLIASLGQTAGAAATIHGIALVYEPAAWIIGGALGILVAYDYGTTARDRGGNA